MRQSSDATIVPGVYFLFLADKLIYVGRSQDCYKRITQHRMGGRPFDFATVMPLTPDLMNKVEPALIKSFQPPQNVVHTDALRSHRNAWRLTRPTESREPREMPARNGLGTVSRPAARDLAIAHGLVGALIDEAMSDGRLTFVESGRIAPRNKKPILVALYDDVVAFCEAERSNQLASLGLGGLLPAASQEAQ